MIVVTRTGRRVDSIHETHQGALEALLRCKDKLGPRQRAFAEDLIRTYSRGRPTDEQLKWIHVLVADATAEQTGERVHFLKVVRLLNVARQRGLKFPKLRGEGMVAKFAYGTVVLTLEGVVVGRVAEDLETLVLASGRKPWPALLAMAEDPVTFGSVCGIRTGHCSFCSRELTHAESVGCGYGPICADKWGMPWGGTAAGAIEKYARLQQSLEELQR